MAGPISWQNMQYLEDPTLQTMLGKPPASSFGPPLPQNYMPPSAMPPPQAAPQAPAPQAAPPEDTSIQDQLDAQSMEALKQQGLTVDQIKKRLGDLQEKDLPLNLAPLAGLADAWTGSHLAATSQPIETAEQRQEAITKLQDAVLKGQQGLSSDQTSILKSKLMAQYHQEDLKQRAEDNAIKRDQTQAYRDVTLDTKAKKQANDQLTAAANGLGKDPAMADALKKKDEFNTLREQVEAAKTNPMAWNTLPMSVVRAFVPRVSAPELAASTGEKDIAGRLEQFEQQQKTGTISPQNAIFMTKLVDTLEKANNRNLQTHIERHAKVYSTTSGKPVEQAADEISGGLYGQVKVGPSSDEKSAAKAWLADPKNANVDPQKRAAIQALVQ